ncbi:MAG: hypothetical protein AB7O31_07610 [Burkholderiales bacterium]
MLDARILLRSGAMLEVLLQPQRRYRLRYGSPGAWQVIYEDGWRSVHGRRSAYEFRSVEQMRYDFERDVEGTQAQDR